ncbi:MAG: hypothetical protein AAFQ65_06685 [Myxococcota bacterium]
MHHRYLSGPLLLIALLAGCASKRIAPPLVGEQSGWYEVSTAHFRFITDLKPEKAKRFGRRLELLYTALGATIGFRPTLEIRGVVVAERESLDEFFPDTLAGMVITSDVPFFVIPTFRRQDGPAVLLHELAHVFIAYGLPGLPLWLNEGIATYVGNTSVDFEDGTVIYGQVDRAALASIDSHQISAVQTLEQPHAWRFDHDDLGLHYASAWFWVHFLKNKYPTSFERFLDRIFEGEPSHTAWREEFEIRSADALHAELRDYRRAGHYDRWRIRVDRYTGPVRLRAASAADVYVLRARLAPLKDGGLTASRNELRRALAVDPRHLEAGWRRFALAENKEAAELAALNVVSHHPQTIEGRLLEAWYADEGRDEKLVDVLQAHPDNALALRFGYSHCLQAKKVDCALALGERLLDKVPWNATLAAELATIAAKEEDCIRARALWARAIGILPETSQQLEQSASGAALATCAHAIDRSGNGPAGHRSDF